MRDSITTDEVQSTGEILANASYTPSLKARDKMKENCDGCRRSQKSKIPFIGPLPTTKHDDPLWNKVNDCPIEESPE